MPGFQLTKDRVDQAREFLLQYLRDAGYEGSLDDGTVLNDLLIKGYSLLYAMIQQTADKAAAYQSIKNAQENKDLLGDEYDSAIDAILSNMFVSRKGGQPTTGRLRLWFTRPVNYLQLDTGQALFKHSSDLFEVQTDYVFSPSDFQAVTNTPQYQEEYAVEVDVVSQESKEIQISAGDIFSSYVNSVYFIKAEAVQEFSPGKDQESSDDFIARTDKALTTRELISRNAVFTVLTEQFDAVNEMYVAGHGDPEQIRDIVGVTGLFVHVGNKADIYIKSYFNIATQACTVGVGGTVDLATELLGTGQVATVLGVVKDGESHNYTVATTEGQWLAKGAPCLLHVEGVDPGDAVTVQYLHCPDVLSVSDFIVSNDNRVSCYDPIVKSMHPVILIFQLNVTPKAGILQATVEPQVRSAVISYVSGLAHTESYAESALIEHLHHSVPGLLNVQVPINASYAVYDERQEIASIGFCGSTFTAPSDPDQSDQISANTIQFYTHADFISFI